MWTDRGKLKKGPIRKRKIYLSRALMASSESSRSWGSCLFVSGAGLAPAGARGAGAAAVIQATMLDRQREEVWEEREGERRCDERLGSNDRTNNRKKRKAWVVWYWWQRVNGVEEGFGVRNGVCVVGGYLQ